MPHHYSTLSKSPVCDPPPHIPRSPRMERDLKWREMPVRIRRLSWHNFQSPQWRRPPPPRMKVWLHTLFTSVLLAFTQENALGLTALGWIAATFSLMFCFQIHCCPWFLFVHLALEISSEEEVLRLGTLVPMNIEVATKYPLSQDRIVVFEIRLHSKSPMLYRPALHGNWNALCFARRALKDKFPTPTVPLTTILQNRQVFLPDPV